MTARRFEYKYGADLRQAELVREWAGLFCDPDPHGDAGRYVVGSLYFDTWDWRLAAQTARGDLRRHKVRVRTYGGGSWFAELKEKDGAAVWKVRAPLPAGWSAGGDGSAPAFWAAVAQEDLRPRLWVQYTRAAFVSRHGDGVRLTIDAELCAQEFRDRDPEPGRWEPIEATPTVVELKFSGAYPRWSERLARAASLQRRSFSKYLHAVRRVGGRWTA